MSLLTLNLTGSPCEIGRQHGRQVLHLRPLLVQVIAGRLAELRRLDADRSQAFQPAREALEALDRPLLDFLVGLAEELALAYEDLLRYALSSYLKDLHKVSGGDGGAGLQASTRPTSSIRKNLPTLDGLVEGCTTWAAAGSTTRDGRPLLAKNRDYHQDHIPLQALARISPTHGYRAISLGSAGSPHVFSSGINERGLAVADTHVLSRDIGPGLPRFSLMREILERHDSTRSALDYLRSAQHMGAGTLILADARGHLAVCESGHRRSGYRESRYGAPLASTNDFVSPELTGQWIEDEPPLLQGNSPARRSRVLAALDASAGQVDVAWAQALMAAHGSAQDAICRHPLSSDGPAQAVLNSSSISSIIFLPAGLPEASSTQPALLLAAGQPCQAEWQQERVEG